MRLVTSQVFKGLSRNFAMTVAVVIVTFVSLVFVGAALLLQTQIDNTLPDEMRWLAMFEEVTWPGLPASFRRHFAVVAERIETAQRWIHAPVVSQLLNIVEGEGGAVRAQSPLLLMLVRGKVYLRMEHTQRSLTEIAQATQLLLAAAQGALQTLPPPAAAGGPMEAAEDPQ